MNKQDLRVVKTRNNIKKIFMEMLKESPIDKISVTALAERARINKGTFYLHYHDIYELYNEMRDEFLQEMINSMDYCPLLFTDPEHFMKKFSDTSKHYSEWGQLLWPNNDMYLFQPSLNDRIIQKIYDTCPINNSPFNDMALDIIINSVLKIFYEDYVNSEPETSIRIITLLIGTFFPPKSSGSG